MLYRRIPAADSLPVIFVDDDFLVGGSLEIALRSRGWDAHRIGATNPEGILSEARRFPAAVALRDLTSGTGPSGTPFYGTEFVPEMARQRKRVLIVSDSVDTAVTAATIAAGASGEVPRLSSVLDTVVGAVARMPGRPVMTEVERHRWLPPHREFEHERGNWSTAWIPIVRTHINWALWKLEVDSQIDAVSLLHSARLRGVLEFHEVRGEVHGEVSSGDALIA